MEIGNAHREDRFADFRAEIDVTPRDYRQSTNAQTAEFITKLLDRVDWITEVRTSINYVYVICEVPLGDVTLERFAKRVRDIADASWLAVVSPDKGPRAAKRR